MERSPTPPGKYNPYYLPEPEGCGKRTNCPYKSMPPQLHPPDFDNQSMLDFTDSYCSTCERKLKLIVPPPPPPKAVEPTIKPPVSQPEPKSWFRKYGWLLVILLVLIAGLIYWLYPFQKFCEQGTVVAGKDTCINEVKYAIICDGKGGFDKGDKIGSCVPVCDSGTVVKTFCKGGDQYVQVCDGKGGYVEKLKKANSPDCPQPETHKPGPPPFKPGIPYVVNRGGRCVEEVYDRQGRIQRQKPLEPGDPRCKKAVRAPQL
ncbi:hypothetical protein [Larkinella rosea]|uniref:Uncharacterized protein n=1 Tax=Larkinella rosea TaxID=2025312 RepID=A0A3P1BGB5_9BACT|nr:hypothetical protein [Larkinella rosea]RRB00115.1 hypothetical protein EHT25_26185 [Larkinella rosea]